MKYSVVEIATGHIVNIIEWDGEPYTVPLEYSIHEWEPGEEIWKETVEE